MVQTLLRLLLTSLLIVRAMAAIAPNTTVINLMGMIPDCAVSCVVQDIFDDGGCSTSSVVALAACACTNITMQSQLSACVQQSCDFTYQQEVTAFAAALCEAHPKESRVNELKIVSIITIGLSIPFLLLRLYSRWINTRRLWSDDIYAIIAAVLLIAVSVIILQMSLMGFGLHYWNVPTKHGIELLKLFYVCQMLYISVQVFAKVSILALYSRLFPDFIHWFQWSVRGMIAFMFIHGLVFFLLVVFQCWPIESIWNKTSSGKCIPVTAVIGFTGAGLSIAEDFIILLLPIRQLWRLQMDTRKKVGLVVLLGVGSFASITSIVRLRFMMKYSNTYDSTWDNVDVIKWSLIEILSACVCGNLLPLRPLIDKILSCFRPVLSRQSNRSHGCSDKGSIPLSNSKSSSSKKLETKLDPVTSPQSLPMSWSLEKHQNEPKASRITPPTIPSPRDMEKNIESHQHNFEEKDAHDMRMAMTNKDPTAFLNLAQTTNFENEGRLSPSWSERNLISSETLREHRISGPWSRALALLDRR